MWLHLNKRFLQYFLVLVFLASGSLCLYSEESPLLESELQDLSKEQLIQAVLIYDKALIELESLMSEDELSLILRETALQERLATFELREAGLNERETLLILQESLSETLIIQSRQNYAKGFREGSTVSGILFAFLGGLVVYNITD